MNIQEQIDQETVKENGFALIPFTGGMGLGPCIRVKGVLDDLGHPQIINLTAEQAGALGRALCQWSDNQG